MSMFPGGVLWDDESWPDPVSGPIWHTQPPARNKCHVDALPALVPDRLRSDIWDDENVLPGCRISPNTVFSRDDPIVAPAVSSPEHSAGEQDPQGHRSWPPPPAEVTAAPLPDPVGVLPPHHVHREQHVADSEAPAVVCAPARTCDTGDGLTSTSHPNNTRRDIQSRNPPDVQLTEQLQANHAPGRENPSPAQWDSSEDALTVHASQESPAPRALRGQLVAAAAATEQAAASGVVCTQTAEHIERARRASDSAACNGCGSPDAPIAAAAVQAAHTDRAGAPVARTQHGRNSGPLPCAGKQAPEVRTGVSNEERQTAPASCPPPRCQKQQSPDGSCQLPNTHDRRHMECGGVTPDVCVPRSAAPHLSYLESRMIRLQRKNVTRSRPEVVALPGSKTSTEEPTKPMETSGVSASVASKRRNVRKEARCNVRRNVVPGRCSNRRKSAPAAAPKQAPDGLCAPALEELTDVTTVAAQVEDGAVVHEQPASHTVTAQADAVEPEQAQQEAADAAVEDVEPVPVLCEQPASHTVTAQAEAIEPEEVQREQPDVTTVAAVPAEETQTDASAPRQVSQEAPAAASDEQPGTHGQQSETDPFAWICTEAVGDHISSVIGEKFVREPMCKVTAGSCVRVDIFAGVLENARTQQETECPVSAASPAVPSVRGLVPQGPDQVPPSTNPAAIASAIVWRKWEGTGWFPGRVYEWHPLLQMHTLGFDKGDDVPLVERYNVLSAPVPVSFRDPYREVKAGSRLILADTPGPVLQKRPVHPDVYCSAVPPLPSPSNVLRSLLKQAWPPSGSWISRRLPSAGGEDGLEYPLELPNRHCPYKAGADADAYAASGAAERTPTADEQSLWTSLCEVDADEPVYCFMDVRRQWGPLYSFNQVHRLCLRGMLPSDLKLFVPLGHHEFPHHKRLFSFTPTAAVLGRQHFYKHLLHNSTALQAEPHADGIAGSSGTNAQPQTAAPPPEAERQGPDGGTDVPGTARLSSPRDGGFSSPSMSLCPTSDSDSEDGGAGAVAVQGVEQPECQSLPPAPERPVAGGGASPSQCAVAVSEPHQGGTHASAVETQGVHAHAAPCSSTATLRAEHQRALRRLQIDIARAIEDAAKSKSAQGQQRAVRKSTREQTAKSVSNMKTGTAAGCQIPADPAAPAPQRACCGRHKRKRSASQPGDRGHAGAHKQKRAETAAVASPSPTPLPTELPPSTPTPCLTGDSMGRRQARGGYVARGIPPPREGTGRKSLLSAIHPLGPPSPRKGPARLPPAAAKKRPACGNHFIGSPAPSRGDTDPPPPQPDGPSTSRAAMERAHAPPSDAERPRSGTYYMQKDTELQKLVEKGLPQFQMTGSMRAWFSSLESPNCTQADEQERAFLERLLLRHVELQERREECRAERERAAAQAAQRTSAHRRVLGPSRLGHLYLPSAGPPVGATCRGVAGAGPSGSGCVNHLAGGRAGPSRPPSPPRQSVKGGYGRALEMTLPMPPPRALDGTPAEIRMPPPAPRAPVQPGEGASEDAAEGTDDESDDEAGPSDDAEGGPRVALNFVFAPAIPTALQGNGGLWEHQFKRLPGLNRVPGACDSDTACMSATVLLHELLRAGTSHTHLLLPTRVRCAAPPFKEFVAAVEEMATEKKNAMWRARRFRAGNPSSLLPSSSVLLSSIAAQLPFGGVYIPPSHRGARRAALVRSRSRSCKRSRCKLPAQQPAGVSASGKPKAPQPRSILRRTTKIGAVIRVKKGSKSRVRTVTFASPVAKRLPASRHMKVVGAQAGKKGQSCVLAPGSAVRQCRVVGGAPQRVGGSAQRSIPRGANSAHAAKPTRSSSKSRKAARAWAEMERYRAQLADIMARLEDGDQGSPPPPMRPRTPPPRARCNHEVYSYSNHAPATQAHVNTEKEAVLAEPVSSSTRRRYARMGKNPDCQFVYVPPRPAAPANPKRRSSSAPATACGRSSPSKGAHRARLRPAAKPRASSQPATTGVGGKRKKEASQAAVKLGKQAGKGSRKGTPQRRHSERAGASQPRAASAKAAHGKAAPVAKAAAGAKSGNGKKGKGAAKATGKGVRSGKGTAKGRGAKSAVRAKASGGKAAAATKAAVGKSVRGKAAANNAGGSKGASTSKAAMAFQGVGVRKVRGGRHPDGGRAGVRVGADGIQGVPAAPIPNFPVDRLAAILSGVPGACEIMPFSHCRPVHPWKGKPPAATQDASSKWPAKRAKPAARAKPACRAPAARRAQPAQVSPPAQANQSSRKAQQAARRPKTAAQPSKKPALGLKLQCELCRREFMSPEQEQLCEACMQLQKRAGHESLTVHDVFKHAVKIQRLNTDCLPRPPQLRTIIAEVLSGMCRANELARLRAELAVQAAAAGPPLSGSPAARVAQLQASPLVKKHVIALSAVGAVRALARNGGDAEGLEELPSTAELSTRAQRLARRSSVGAVPATGAKDAGNDPFGHAGARTPVTGTASPDAPATKQPATVTAAEPTAPSKATATRASKAAAAAQAAGAAGMLKPAGVENASKAAAAAPEAVAEVTTPSPAPKTRASKAAAVRTPSAPGHTKAAKSAAVAPSTGATATTKAAGVTHASKAAAVASRMGTNAAAGTTNPAAATVHAAGLARAGADAEQRQAGAPVAPRAAGINRGPGPRQEGGPRAKPPGGIAAAARAAIASRGAGSTANAGGAVRGLAAAAAVGAARGRPAVRGAASRIRRR